MSNESDPIQEYLNDGWEICGFSVCMMALGATSRHILLRKGNSLAEAIILNNGRELARSVGLISPKPELEQKKGFWG